VEIVVHIEFSRKEGSSGTMFAPLRGMRLLHVSAVSFAGIALVASPLMRPRAQTTDVRLPAAVHRPVPAELDTATSTEVTVVDELVTADTVAPRARPLARPRAQVHPAPATRRSLLARVFLGSGDPRPRPFPQPAGEYTVRTR
jgi:hypothetical protein